MVRAKEFRDPAKGGFNLSNLEEEKWKAGKAPSYKFEFFLEGDLLAHCFPGMKALTKVFELNCGIHFFDEIDGLFAEFLRFPCKMISMIDYKIPKTKEITDKWIVQRAEHRKEMEALAGPKLSDREQARALLRKDLTMGADYDEAFGTRKHIPADDDLGFEYDVVPQPGVPADAAMGIIVPRYEGQKKDEDQVTEIVDESEVVQGESTNQKKPKEWWTPEQWWAGEEWYGLVKDWKPTMTPAEKRPAKKSISTNGCFVHGKKEDNLLKLKENLRVNGELIQRKEAEMKNTVFNEKDTASYTKWLKFAKPRLNEEKSHILDVEGEQQLRGTQLPDRSPE